MPTRNLGPCDCCGKTPVSFQVLSIGGDFAGSRMVIGMWVEFEQGENIVFQINYSDGTTSTVEVGSSSVAYQTEPSATRLYGTLQFGGYSGDWSFLFGWGTYGGDTIYAAVDGFMTTPPDYRTNIVFPLTKDE